MSRKRCHRRVLPALPPRGLRPRLTPDQLRDLGLVHHEQLDALLDGTATEDTLWHVVSSVLTWSRAAELLQVGLDEMLDQVALVTRIVERYRATGLITLQPTEAELARDGVQVMTELARIVDRPTAVAAAEWSEAKLNTMRPMNGAKFKPDGSISLFCTQTALEVSSPKRWHKAGGLPGGENH